MSIDKRIVLKAACGVYRVKTAEEPVLQVPETFDGFMQRMYDAQSAQNQSLYDKPLQTLATEAGYVAGFNALPNTLSRVAGLGGLTLMGVDGANHICFNNPQEYYGGYRPVTIQRNGFWNTAGNVGETAINIANPAVRGLTTYSLLRNGAQSLMNYRNTHPVPGQMLRSTAGNLSRSGYSAASRAAPGMFNRLPSVLSRVSPYVGPVGAVASVLANPTPLGDSEIHFDLYNPEYNPYVPSDASKAPPVYNPNATTEEQAAYMNSWNRYATENPVAAAYYTLENQNVPFPVNTPEEEQAISDYYAQQDAYDRAYGKEGTDADRTAYNNTYGGLERNTINGEPRLPQPARNVMHRQFVSAMRPRYNQWKEYNPNPSAGPRQFMDGVKAMWFDPIDGEKLGRAYGNPFYDTGNEWDEPEWRKEVRRTGKYPVIPSAPLTAPEEPVITNNNKVK